MTARYLQKEEGEAVHLMTQRILPRRDRERYASTMNLPLATTGRSRPIRIGTVWRDGTRSPSRVFETFSAVAMFACGVCWVATSHEQWEVLRTYIISGYAHSRDMYGGVPRASTSTTYVVVDQRYFGAATERLSAYLAPILTYNLCVTEWVTSLLGIVCPRFSAIIPIRS